MVGVNATWVPKPRGERGEVSFFGHLVFEQQLPAPGRLELIPYTLARGEFLPTRASEGGASAGLDARWGLGTGATLSATFNPDFGIQFNQFLIRDDEPFLMHTGMRKMFPITRDAVASFIRLA